MSTPQSIAPAAEVADPAVSVAPAQADQQSAATGDEASGSKRKAEDGSNRSSERGRGSKRGRGGADGRHSSRGTADAAAAAEDSSFERHVGVMSAPPANMTSAHREKLRKSYLGKCSR